MALSLVGLLAIIVYFSFVSLLAQRGTSKDLHDLLAIIVGPVVGLVGAVTGFYYGAGSGHRHQ